MAHVEKFKKSSIFAVCAHCDRNPNITLSNVNIHSELSHLNYNLAESFQPLPGHQFVLSKMKELNAKRKDLVVMVSWIVTLPKEIKSEDEDKFFKTTFDYLVEKYGKDNVVSAYVHKDETTPHLHFLFCPIIKTDGKEKFRCKDIINRSVLKSFHNNLNNHVSKELGYNAGIINGVIEERNGIHYKTIDELRKANVLLDKEHSNLNSLVNNKLDELNNIENEKILIEEEIHGLLNSDDLISEMIELKRENSLLKQVVDFLEKIIQEMMSFLESYGFDKFKAKIENMLDSIFNGKTNDYER